MPESDKKIGDYSAIIEDIFQRFLADGAMEFEFDRDEIERAAERLQLRRPRNLGDVVYTFRYRRSLPDSLLARQPEGRHWIILGAGDARYRVRLARLKEVSPRSGMIARKIPDATPEIISRYALSDEQALLAKVRYNRLIDIFLGISAYSIQNHLRTKVNGYGQIEIDELYVGLDGRAAHYVIPVQAKVGNDKLGVIQTIQDVLFCQGQERYRNSIVKPVSAQFMGDETIAMFELDFDGDEVAIVDEKHYRLVPQTDISTDDLRAYRSPLS